MKMDRGSVGKFLGAAIASSMVFASANAGAFWVRQHGSACFSVNTQLVVSNNVINYGGPAGLYCPVPDSDTTQPSSMTTVNVHVEDFSTVDGFLVQPCWTSWNSSAGNCDAYQTTSPSFTGEKAFSFGAPASFASSHAADFKYVRISMPDSGSYPGFSAVHGLFYSN
jgi:hypothetical protein